MLTQERYNRILSELALRQTMTISELTELLNSSESTVRRDLYALDKLGKLKKVHGGAAALQAGYVADEADVNTKQQLYTAEKAAIGEYAAKLIYPDDFVYIDAGTTTERLIDFLGGCRATFVTNGVAHAKKLIQQGCKAYVIGGQLKLSTEAIVGSDALVNLRKYNFTKCFIGTNGISIDNGYTTPDTEEALVKTEVMSRSYVSYVLADSSKFSQVSSVTFAPIAGACIVTDQLPDERYRQHTVVKCVSQADEKKGEPSE